MLAFIQLTDKSFIATQDRNLVDAKDKLIGLGYLVKRAFDATELPQGSDAEVAYLMGKFEVVA